jgi:hypothetical protein
MNGIRVFGILLIAGSLSGGSLTLAAAADADRSRLSSGARSEPAVKTPARLAVRSARKPRAAARTVRRAPEWPQASWPYRPYERIAIHWPVLFIGVGY